MAEYSITADSVRRSLTSTLEQGIAGATLARTAPLIYQGADNRWYPAKADGAAPIYKALAWVLNDAGADQPISFVRLDPLFTPGFAIAEQEIAILSWTTPGKLRPIADIGSMPSGGFLTIACIGIGSNLAQLCMLNVNVAKP